MTMMNHNISTTVLEDPSASPGGNRRLSSSRRSRNRSRTHSSLKGMFDSDIDTCSLSTTGSFDSTKMRGSFSSERGGLSAPDSPTSACDDKLEKDSYGEDEFKKAAMMARKLRQTKRKLFLQSINPTGSSSSSSERSVDSLRGLLFTLSMVDTSSEEFSWNHDRPNPATSSSTTSSLDQEE